MSLLRRERRDWTPEPFVSPFPGVSFFGGAVDPTPDSALRESAVWACVRLLADAVSMMPVSEFTLRDGIRVSAPDSPLVRRPSADASMNEWMYMLMVSALLRGNTFGVITRRDNLQYPVQIELQSPDRVRVTADKNSGLPVYVVNGTQVPREDMFHFRAFRFPGAVQGLSPISYASRTLQTGAAVTEFALGFFRDGAHPSSVLTTDQPVNQDQALTIKERFMAAVRGREPVVLGQGVKYQAIQVSPEESQFLATSKANIADICRIFGVPPEMVAAEVGNSLTYSNVEQRALDFLTYSVQPWLSRIEDAFGQLLPGQRHIRFDTSVLVRADFETTMKATAIGIASKQMLPDEARALRDQPPLTESQKSELDLIPLDVSPTGIPKLLKLPTAAPVPADPTAAPTTEGRAAVQQPSIVVNNHPPAYTHQAGDIYVAAPEVRNELTLPEPVIHNHVEAAPAPSVTVENRVEPTPVDVHVENRVSTPRVQVDVAAPPAPTVNVTPTLIAQMPTRQTTTEIERDRTGLITKTTSTETDA